MKKIINNICYVEAEDLLRFPIPNFIKIPTIINSNEFVRFETKEEIEYFKSRQDIVDYDLISELSQKDLDKMIKETKERFIKLSSDWLESSKRGRTKLNKDEEYQNNLKIFKAIYDCLSNYSINKKHIDFIMKYIELNYACKKYPRIQLLANGKSLLDTFDPECIANNFAEDGFIENYCLSDEEREQVKKIRELVKSTVQD